MLSLNTRQWSTPAVIAAGVFMSVSGVLMFFGMHDPVTLAHEWIGLAFVVFVVFHISTHWRGFAGYFSRRAALGIIAVVGLATASLIGLSASHEGGGDMKHRMFQTFERAPLTEIAPLLDESADSLSAKLQAGGFKVASTAQSIEEIASRNGTRPPELMHALFE
ncbi:DUF4405 domain-containing protein [Thiocystis violascens]|uniref:Flavinylation-associated cytochrome domain-containing protein n=1 Tax=Thiocystis violascens (strain ATCC 17096 / DSM 198 / 6111) TaxID=765911 RepID=I3YFD4_THIV6|nr:DUF4405 domain-containing protein [Thiocystis violascens]AFL75702.1 hypothetical protein Thivi_3861 [Thiocystis violascens DSM 198]